MPIIVKVTMPIMAIAKMDFTLFSCSSVMTGMAGHVHLFCGLMKFHLMPLMLCR